ncbi:MAG: DUF3253 domain-containing protein [Alphaproteobacteria bacterium]|nr:DUF3253 domain-containing protein [Alphaproteobacteria bacterium]
MSRGSTDGAQGAIRTLLAERAEGATLCPSEAARLMAGTGGDWRGLMPHVHRAAAELLNGGAIALSWKGRPLDAPVGPYRIGRAD